MILMTLRLNSLLGPPRLLLCRHPIPPSLWPVHPCSTTFSSLPVTTWPCSVGLSQTLASVPPPLLPPVELDIIGLGNNLEATLVPLLAVISY